MSYKYYQQQTKPVACFLMGDATPFDDISGNAQVANTKSGSTNPTLSVPLVAGAANSSVFDNSHVGEFTNNVFQQGLEARNWAIAVWMLPIPNTTTATQAVMSHTGQTDGITVNGSVIRFSTDYLTNGSAAVTYDLQIPRKAFVVVQHSFASNELWVDGELVARVDITNAQQNDTFVATTNKLYAGTSTANCKVAVQAVGFYNSLTSEDISALYQAGNNITPQYKIAPQLNGDTYNLARDFGSYYIDQTWEDTADFSLGEITNVSVYGDKIGPVLDGSLNSVAGTWKIGLPLDTAGATSIYGVALQWSGSGITVDVSLDGSSWTAAVSGSLVSILPSGTNPTGKDMHIRVSIPSGVANSTAYLDSIRAIGFLNNTFANGMGRAITISSPAVLREDYEPFLYRDDNGVSLKTGTLTIGLDTSVEPKATRTLEAWVKPLSGTPTINGATWTKYRNGAADTSLPLGEWSLIHYVGSADLAGNITITGDIIVGQVSIYPTALTVGNVAYLWQSYTGKPIVSVADSSAITLTEPVAPVLIYAHDWSVDGGGG